MISFQIEKCSESSGINCVLFFFNFFKIISQAHTIVSLLAIKIFFVNGIILRVGSRPLIPEIELMQKLTLFFKILSILLFIPKNKLIFFF